MFRHTIAAAQVATVGNSQPNVINYPVMCICKHALTIMRRQWIVEGLAVILITGGKAFKILFHHYL